jgi:hypothetical protein
MTLKNQGCGMAMCRHCGHDLYVVKHGKSQGEIRCSNKTCRFATSNYKMGKNTNEGPVVA